MTRQGQPRGSDVCECGDYRSDHSDGVGPCRVCVHSAVPYDGCEEFCFSRRATVAERKAWQDVHGKGAGHAKDN